MYKITPLSKVITLRNLQYVWNIHQSSSFLVRQDKPLLKKKKMFSEKVDTPLLLFMDNNKKLLIFQKSYSVAELVKNLSAMRETWVQSLGWEDLLEKGEATHSSIPAWGIPWTV